MKEVEEGMVVALGRRIAFDVGLGDVVRIEYFVELAFAEFEVVV